MNLLLLTDSYKITHWRQYPPGTENVYSYYESRGGRWPEAVFFGLQYYLKHYFEGVRVRPADLDEADAFLRLHLGRDYFNRAGWQDIIDRHGGRLPVVIRAVPEGSVVPNHNVLMTIENTDPACFWLPNYLETLLVQTWYGTTVATQSREMKKIIHANLEETGDPAQIDYKLHDFGFRGVSSVESAGVGGAAHLVHFRGTDTLAGLLVARDYYDCPMAGHSIPASEHSTITAWGPQHERDAFANMLDQFPEGMVACVSDSFDVFRACSEYWGRDLKERVLNRNGTLVIRPDSGDPCGVLPRVFQLLGDAFGYSANAKGYKLLPPAVRVIQGDAVDLDSLPRMLDALKRAGWSGDNISFGSGGGLLQKLNRDTLKFAFKCSSVRVRGVERDVFKEPVTQPGKRSKAGRLKLIRDAAGWRTVAQSAAGDDHLVEVFRDGRVTRSWTFDEVRDRARL